MAMTASRELNHHNRPTNAGTLSRPLLFLGQLARPEVRISGPFRLLRLSFSRVTKGDIRKKADGCPSSLSA